MKLVYFTFAALLPLAAMAAPAGAVETNKVKQDRTELVQAQPKSPSWLDKAFQGRQVEKLSPANAAPTGSGNYYNWMGGGGG